MKRARSRAHRIAAVAIVALSVGACVDVLQLNGYEDAVEGLCGDCTELPDCRARLDKSLSDATEAEARDWLARYKDLGCADKDCSSVGQECFYTAPGNCTAKDGACDVSEGCCGFYDDPQPTAACCAFGDGTCCDHCISCAAALGKKPNPDMQAICNSQAPQLQAVLDCKSTKCSLACKLQWDATCDLCLTKDCKSVCGQQPETAACKECRASTCRPEIDACNAAKAP